MFTLMTAYAVELLALGMGVAFIVWAKRNEGPGRCLASWTGYLIALLSILTIMGTFGLASMHMKGGMMMKAGFPHHMGCECPMHKLLPAPDKADAPEVAD